MNFIQNIIITSLLIVPLSMFGVVCDAQILKDVNHQEDQKWMTLIRAINTGDLLTVRELIAAGVDLDFQNEYGHIALMRAVHQRLIDSRKAQGWINIGIPELLVDLTLSRRLDIVKELLAAGADVNMQNRYGETALMTAVASKDLDTVKELITAGADVNMQNRYGETALYRASSNGSKHSGIVEELIAAGANVSLICSKFRFFRKWSCNNFNKKVIMEIIND